MRISDWSSDVCSSDLHSAGAALVPDSFDLPCRMAVSPADIGARRPHHLAHTRQRQRRPVEMDAELRRRIAIGRQDVRALDAGLGAQCGDETPDTGIGRVGNLRQQEGNRSEEHTSELQALMRISYAVFSL